MQSKFEVGDRVVRLGPNMNYGSVGVETGKTYTVTKVSRNGADINVSGFNGNNVGFESKFFILEDLYNSPLYKALS